MKIYILSIGVNDYGGQIAIPNLQCAVNDAVAVFRTFRNYYNADGALLCSDQIELKSTEKPLNVGLGTRQDILEAINNTRRFLESKDLFVFFFSGHGIQENPGYILPHSAEYGRPGTYLMYRTLFGTLSTLPCEKFACFLNCCYAGQAAASGAMPGMVVPKKRAVLFAATDDRTVTTDHLPGDGNGCSPFSEALVEYLQGVSPGVSFSPEALQSQLEKDAHHDIIIDGRNVTVRPVFTSTVEAIGSGLPQFQIQRPGFRLDFDPVQHCMTGETLRVPVRVHDVAGEKIVIKAESQLTGFEPLKMEVIDDSVLEMRFEYPGQFGISIIANSSDANKIATRTLTVNVRQGESPPLELEEQALPPCQFGTQYEAYIRVFGGSLPYHVEMEGLPGGLQYMMKDETTIRLYGTPSDQEGPVVHMLKISVKDGFGQQCLDNKRLIVYKPESYCMIKSGEYVVGCKKDRETIQAISKILRPNFQQIAARYRIDPEALEKATGNVATSEAARHLDGIVAVSPYSKVHVRKYLIKKYPVTNKDWLCYLEVKDAPHIPQYNWPPQEDDLLKPVTGISFEAICDYLQWKGTRLPTAREWQVAADEGKGNLFPWGDEFEGSQCNMLDGKVEKGLVKVDTYDVTYQSPTGTRDMVGNAAEWVERRVYWPQKRSFAQVFRGGSFRDFPVYGIISHDSREVGVLFGMDEDNGQIGATSFDWLGFRDVIELDLSTDMQQTVVQIPACDVQLDANVTKHVSAFHMARYAVSNLEYWGFVRSSGHRRPLDWEMHGDGLPFPHHKRHLPVVNVSYLDAHTFCLWKSRKEEAVYRLPTARQWLAAQQGGEFRRFPWGRDFNLQFCNAIDSGWGKRLAVFELDEGQSKHGVYNLVGNVYEWVSPLELRGGSWLKDCNQMAETGFCAGVRNDKHAADFLKGDVGFRYVRLEAPPEKENVRE